MMRSTISDSEIQASLETDGRSISDYAIFGRPGHEVVCEIVGIGQMGVIADDDDARAKATIDFLKRRKAPHAESIEGLEKIAAEIVTARSKKNA